MKVAYVLNQHPKTSHSFIRREILALERQGLEVERIAMRGWNENVPDPQDREEAKKTRYVLAQGAVRMAAAIVREALARPSKFLRAAALALRVSKGSDRSLLFHLIYLAEACVVAGWVRRSRVQHMHAHFGTNAAEVAMLASVLSDRPFSFTVHGPEEFDRPEALALAEKIRRANFVVAISSYGRSQLYRWVEHDHWSKVKIVHCGLDAEFLAANPAPVVGTNQLVCVGRLCEQKGQMLLLDALQAVLRSGQGCTLVLAGDGEFRPLIEARARELGIAEHVRITGWISGAQVRAEIDKARALVLPSFAEGLPVVLMEAMVLGRPVMSTYVAGIPELVLDGKTGWLVPAGDVDALARAMREVLGASEEQLAEMGRAARTRAIERHDIDGCAAQLAQLFAREAATELSSLERSAESHQS